MRILRTLALPCLVGSGCAYLDDRELETAARAFVAAASRQDSAAMAGMATSATPVAGMLSLARSNGPLVQAGTRGVHVVASGRLGDTSMVSMRMGRIETPTLGFRFERGSGRWLVVQVRIEHDTDVGPLMRISRVQGGKAK
jgi:hypothetical protein